MNNIASTTLCFFLLSLVSFGFVSIGVSEESQTNSFEEPPLEQADREYWAYQPVSRPVVPVLENDDWSQTPIDQFILAELRSQELQPVERADRLSLLRRVTFNLTGLPPTPEEIASFLKDERPASFEHVISRLLDSSAYGERWAQHWLDLVRFAETDGFEHDKVRPESWRYRDWVVDALNQDLPFDSFVKFQIAGDEVAPDSFAALIATGYLLAGPDMPDINSQSERRHNFLNAMTANVGEVFLGLRFGCAQCHHHRTDPISQNDFYRLRAFFETIDLFQKQTIQDDENQTEIKARVTKNMGKDVPASHLWIRGDFTRPGPELTAQFPRVIAKSFANVDRLQGGQGRRLALANWLTERNQPLTARVMVNRIWQHHFGVGLISTPSDFGWMGEPASHPELLDWLAVEFMESGWGMKHIHRLILSSACYQLASSQPKDATAEQVQKWNSLIKADRENRLLGRMNRRRLEGEAIRDAILAVSGKLNRKPGGPGVRPPLPKAVAATLLRNQWPVTKNPEEHVRRSLYLFARRNLRMPLLESFDKPDANLSCPSRSQTTIAPQALHLLNSDFVRNQASHFALRVLKSSSRESEQIQTAYQLALGRPASESEVSNCQKFLAVHIDRETAWIDFCHVLYNLNEFVYVD